MEHSWNLCFDALVENENGQLFSIVIDHLGLLIIFSFYVCNRVQVIRSFPYKAQQLLPMLFIFAQRPVELHVFGSISCDRITLKNVGEMFISSQISIEVNTHGNIFRYSTMRIHALWWFDGLRNNIAIQYKQLDRDRGNSRCK